MATPSLEQAKQLLEAAQPIVSSMARARLSGGNFNVFRVLRMEEDEVRLHSRLIAELLDPRGSHGQGSAFLEMFLRQVSCSVPKASRIDAQKAMVEREHYMGRVETSHADSKGGFIDIFITDADAARHISIENKIRHGEGDHQVDRLCNYRPDSNFVLFLTLDGREAKTSKQNYGPISYRMHIVPWLESCHRHCSGLPALRESIEQYLVVVKTLTCGDLLMNEVNEDVKTLLRENLEAARLVYFSYKPTIHEAVRGFAGKLQEALERKKHRLGPGPWKIQNTIDDDPNGRGVQVLSKAWPREGRIGLVKWQYYSGYFEYGFLDPEKRHRDEIKRLLGESVGELDFRQGDRWWAFYKRMSRPNLETDMVALEELFDEGEQDTLADLVACELIGFVTTCDRKFKESTS